ncbi:MAG: DUF2723 domain-containing protein [Bacteroidetes bacterium]|nr:DUF2723 domain-containing protein [Bacteroidota bacterium]
MKKMMVFVQNENVISVLLVIISFFIYLTTMSRSIGFTDSGELATVICTLGIAHPTGYPLFTLLGKLWMLVPFPFEEILRLNILSAFLTAVAVGIFYKTAFAFAVSINLFPRKNSKSKELNSYTILSPAIAALVLAFSSTFWSQSTSIEVFPLHLVLILLSVQLFINGLEEQLKLPNPFSRKLILFAYVLGLGFSNHMTAVLLLPGFIYLFFTAFGFNKESFKRILLLVPVFLLGLSIYLYLPIRSSVKPLLDWGHPASIESFFWHVTGKQFRVWMFSSLDVVKKQLSFFINNFTTEFNITALAFVLIGIIVLFKRSRRIALFLLILFFTTILYAANYDIFDINTYFLLSYIAAGWMAVYGIGFVLDWAGSRQIGFKTAAIAIIAILPVGQVLFNWNRVDQTKNFLPQRFTVNAFSNLEPNAVVLASQWDYFISPSLYYQFVRKERPDIIIIDKSLLQDRSWYYIQLQRTYPAFMDTIRPSADLFLSELNKFEHDKPFNARIIRIYWQNLLNEIVAKSLPERPVYVDARIDREFPSVYSRTPAGLFLRLSRTEDTSYYKTTVADFGIWDKKQPVAGDFEKYYVTMLLREIDWLQKRRRIDEAKAVMNEVIRIQPKQ